MWTKWYTPKIAEALASDEIAYQGGVDLAGIDLVSEAAVSGVAQSQGGLIQQGVRSLVFRDFGIDINTVVSAVELELRVDRLSRIQDREIRLWQGRAVGRNLATALSEDLAVYGGELAQWQVDTVTVNTADFGVLVDLQPHALYPSRDMVYVRSVRLRVYTL